MKRFLSLFTVLFIFSPIISLSAPDFGDNDDSQYCVYDTSYNVELFNRLEKEYFAYCSVQITENYSTNICGINSYGEMVLQPYDRQKQNFDFNTCEVIPNN